MSEELNKPARKDLIKLEAYRKGDTVFASNARLLQSKWRKETLKLEDERGFRINKGEKKFWGNLLPEDAAKAGRNFLTDTIRKVVEKTIKSKQSGALIDERRLYSNMLSSQPLCFNLFGELKNDLKKATIIFNKLFPKLTIEEIDRIEFEYSPKRRKGNYLNDGTAFDVFVEYNNKKCFLGIEVKYSEALKEEGKSKAGKINENKKYEKIARDSGKFKDIDKSVNELKKPPLSQIWRDHLLSIALKEEGGEEGKYEKGDFVFMYPSKNKECRDGIAEYKKYLTDQNSILDIHLENVINEIGEEIKEGWTKDLKLRYLGE